MGLEVFDHYECGGQMEIENIVPVRTLTHLSLFSGIGGLDLAAEWAGFETVGQCEWADYPTKVLEKHWPDVPRWRDIRTLTGGDFYARTGRRTVDIISGGFPCQPFSNAGKRRGKEDDRYLWPEMVRVIAELRPTWVVGENVAGIINMALDTVLSDLESQGYATRAFLIPAAGVNAPHQRYRTAIVAYSKDCYSGGLPVRKETKKSRFVSGSEDVSNTDCTGLQTSRAKQQATGASRNGEDVHNPNRIRYSRQDTRESDCNDTWDDKTSKQGWRTKPNDLVTGCQDVSDSYGTGCKELYFPGITDRERFTGGGTDEGAVCNTAGQGLSDRSSKKVEEFRAEQESERPNCRRGEPDGSRQWATEPRVGRVANGVSHRVDRIKCLGNAVVPQQFYPIFKAIAEIETRIQN